MSNVELFGEGLNLPGVEVVILLRPTQSLVLYIQQSMRSMRPGKNKTAIIIDAVGNVFCHGLPDEPREWSLEGVKRRSKSETASVGIRTCPNCYLCHAPAPVCPYCKYEYQMTPRQLAEESGTLQEYIAEEKKKARMTVGRARTIEDLEKIAEERGYKYQWVRIQARLKNIKK